MPVAGLCVRHLPLGESDRAAGVDGRDRLVRWRALRDGVAARVPPGARYGARLGSLIPHASPACRNVGDRGVIPLALGSNIIPRSTSVSSPAGGALPTGTGSGKLGTPCKRMHLENLSAAVCADAVIFGGVFGPGIRCWHASCARWDDGDCRSRPELGVSSILPFVPGSGKCGTPCDRMHAEYWTACESAIDRDREWWSVEEPHAASSAMQPTPSRTIQIRVSDRISAEVF